MLPGSRERIKALAGEDGLVLDVGGWAKPLARADWVIDLMPYETRGLYGERDPDPEREQFLIDHGFIERLGNSRLRCTPAGMLILDAVVADLACP